MDTKELISRLNEYSQELIAYKLGGEFADACMAAGSALAELQAENDQLKGDVMMLPACVYYKPGGLCRYGGDDPANICVLGPCDHEVSPQDALKELGG